MFNQRKPRRFNIKSKLHSESNTNSEQELRNKWNEMREDAPRRGSVLTSLPVLIIFLILILVLMYILEGY